MFIFNCNYFLVNEVNTSNSTITNKSTNIKPYDESYVNFNKNEISKLFLGKQTV